MGDDNERAFVLAQDSAGKWYVAYAGRGECAAYGALQAIGRGVIAIERQYEPAEQEVVSP